MAEMTVRNHCPKCGQGVAPGSEVCAACGTILLAPRHRMRTPGWVIVLLSAAVSALFLYVCYLAWQVLVLHRY